LRIRFEVQLGELLIVDFARGRLSTVFNKHIELLV
jgi:hypothetical protein